MSQRYQHEELNLLSEEPRAIPGPVRIMIGLFLAILLLITIIPYYAVRLDPRPSRIADLSEVMDGIEVSQSDIILTDPGSILMLVQPADPRVKSVATRVASIGCEGELVCQAKSMYLFVRNNIRYVPDPRGTEYISDPLSTLKDGGGDCDDQALLLANLLGAIGIRTRFVFVPGHVYVQAQLADALDKYKTEADWVTLDSTCKSCEFGDVPWVYSSAQKQYIESR